MLTEIRSGDHPLIDYATEKSLLNMINIHIQSANKTIILQNDRKGFIIASIGYCPFNYKHFIGHEIFHYSANGKKEELFQSFIEWSLSKNAIAIQLSHAIDSRKNKPLSRIYKKEFNNPQGYMYIKRL